MLGCYGLTSDMRIVGQLAPPLAGVIHTMPKALPPADRAEALFLHSEGLDVDAICTVMNTGRKTCVQL